MGARIETDIAPVAASDCTNCGARLTGQYCAQCGQSRGHHDRSIHGLIAEAARENLFLDGKTARSALALCIRPGTLTRAYVAGQRARFVSPLRVYLAASLIFFLMLSASGLVLLQFHMLPLDAAVHAQLAKAMIEANRSNAEADNVDVPVTTAPALEFMKRPFAGSNEPDDWRKVIDQTKERRQAGLLQELLYAATHPIAINSLMQTWFPRLLVLLLPAMAGLLALLNHRQRLFFIDHLAFAMHLQAFAFIVFSLVVLVRAVFPDAHLLFLSVGIILVYMTIAHRTVYPAGWMLTILKSASLATAYTTLLIAGMIGVLAYSLSVIQT